MTIQETLSAVGERLRWNYHVAHPGHDPVYVGRVPAWRFSRLLAASDEVEASGRHENAATGDHRELAFPDTPADVAAQFADTAPDDLAPHVTAVWDGDTLSYTAKPSWQRDTDDVTAFSFNTTRHTYRGRLDASGDEVMDVRDRYLVQPGDYSLVEHTAIDPDEADETVSRMLRGLDDVTGRIPESLYHRRDGQHDYRGWADGDDAARYWEQYIADDLRIIDAEAAVEETGDEVRYGVRVEGVPEHRYTGQDEGSVTRFWSTEPDTGQARDELLHLLDR